MPRTQKALKQDPSLEKFTLAGKTLCPREMVTPQSIHSDKCWRNTEKEAITLQGELGKGGGLVTRSSKADRSLPVWKSEHKYPEAVEYINWKKWDGWVHFNLHANKVLEVQMLSTSKSLWEKFTLSDPKEGINQLLAFPPPYLTVLSGTSPHLHQQWFK